VRHIVKNSNNVYCSKCSCCGALFRKPVEQSCLWMDFGEDHAVLCESNERCLLCGGRLLKKSFKKGGAL